MAKRVSVRAVKAARIYTTEEAAHSVGVSLSTIHNWIRAGMVSLRGQRPTLIRGADLKAWVQGRRAKRTKLAPHEFLCMACKKPQTAYGGMIDVHDHRGAPRLSALCATCGGQMQRLVRRSDLSTLQSIFDVKSIQGPTT